MSPALLRFGGAVLLALAAAAAMSAARAATGVMQLPGREGDLPVTVFYPTAAPATTVQRGPFTLQLAPQAAPVRGNGRLVVVSHGTGGSAWPHADLAMQLVDAGFVVAVADHRGDNWQDQSDAGPASWKRRPLEISRAIDAVAADARLAPLLALDRVGVFGMSAGGHTALTLAGGRWSPAALRAHCEAHFAADRAACTPPVLLQEGKVPEEPSHRRLDDTQWYRHRDARVAAIVAYVPFTAGFDLESLAQPPVPLGIVRSGRDAWLAPAFHASAVLQACRSCELVADLPTAGHGALLSPQPPLPGPIAALLGDPPGFDRALVPAVHARISGFFRKNLLP